MDVGIVPKVDTGSNHIFVRAKLRIDNKMERLRKVQKPKKKHNNLDVLSVKKQQFQLELQNRFALLEDLDEDKPLD